MHSMLLTIPPSVGYEQNPLSLYYCYDVEGSSQHLKKCIAEVGDSNTNVNGTSVRLDCMTLHEELLYLSWIFSVHNILSLLVAWEFLYVV